MSTIASLIVKVAADTKAFVGGMQQTSVAAGVMKSALVTTGTALALHAVGIKTNTGLVIAAGKAFVGLFSALRAGSGLFGSVISGILGIGSAFAKTLPGMLAIAGAAAAIGVALSGMAAVGGVAAIKMAADFEQLEVSFSTMLGSGKKAQQLLSDISEFAAATPFEFTNLSDASRKLVAFGVSQQNLIPTLRSVGDVSAGIGANISEIAEIYGKAKVQGQLFAEDINQLTGRGIPIIQELAKQFGVTDGEVKKLVKEGQVGFANLEQAFVSLTEKGGRFAGMMQAQSQTVVGLSSTLKDNLNLAFRDLGQILTRELGVKDAIKGVVTLTDELRNAIGVAQDLSKMFGGNGTLGQVFRAVAAFATQGSPFRLRQQASDLTGQFVGRSAEDARGNMLEQKRLAAIDAEARRWREGFESKSGTRDWLIAGARDWLGPINKEASRQGSMSPRQIREFFTAQTRDWLGVIPEIVKGTMETLRIRTPEEINRGKDFGQNDLLTLNPKSAAAIEAGTAAAFSASLRGGNEAQNIKFQKEAVTEAKKNGRTLNDIERNTNRLKVVEVAIV